MSHKLFVLFLSIFLLFLNIFAYKEDEYYCKNNKRYQICRRCPTLKEPCPREEFDNKCVCDHIAISDSDSQQGGFKGGANCLSEDDYAFDYCYVGEDSPCDDKKQSKFASEKAKNTDLWHQGNNISYSLAACNEDQSVTGSQAFMEGVMIETDFLLNVETEKNLTFTFDYIDYTEDYDEYQEIEIGWEKCAKQCIARNENSSVCGAWSFDNAEGICYLHTIDACCGQIQKQVKSPTFSSGYVCPHCWSTYNECPCTVKERQSCSTCTLHTTGGVASEPELTSAAALLAVHNITLNKDVCECKSFYRRRRKVWGCAKPCCAEEGAETGCKDENRCRKCMKKQN